MKISEKELQKISERLCSLAFECHFLYDDAKYASRMVGVYDTSSEQVVNRLQDVLRRSDCLLDDLKLVQASLDDLLVRERVILESL